MTRDKTTREALEDQKEEVLRLLDSMVATAISDPDYDDSLRQFGYALFFEIQRAVEHPQRRFSQPPPPTPRT